MDKKRIVFAESTKNGIKFYSSVLPMLYSHSFLNEEGIVETQIIPGFLKPFINFLGVSQQEEEPESHKWKTLSIAIFDIILIGVCTLLFKSFNLTFAACYFSASVSMQLFSFIHNVCELKLPNGTKRSTARFHAAEHMAANAYESLQRTPSLEEIKNFSRFHVDCNTNTTVSNILFHLSLSICLAFIARLNIILYLILIICIPILIRKALKNGWLKYFQVLTTSRPSDIELMVAIEGLKCLDEAETKIISDGGIELTLEIVSLNSPF